MGSSTQATCVRFCSTVWEDDVGDQTSSAPEVVELLKGGPDGRTRFSVAGWECEPSVTVSQGDVFVSELRKSGHIVRYVNQHPYANAGCEISTFFSEKRDSLELFLNDVFPGASMEIKENQAIQQTV
jgi:hypothetical protein